MRLRVVLRGRRHRRDDRVSRVCLYIHGFTTSIDLSGQMTQAWQLLLRAIARPLLSIPGMVGWEGIGFCRNRWRLQSRHEACGFESASLRSGLGRLLWSIVQLRVSWVEEALPWIERILLALFLTLIFGRSIRRLPVSPSIVCHVDEL